MANEKGSSTASDSVTDATRQGADSRRKLTQVATRVANSRIGFIVLASVGIIAIASVGFFGTRHVLSLNAEVGRATSELETHEDLASQKAELETRAKTCADYVLKEISYMETFQGALSVIGPQTSNMWHSGIRNVDYGAYMNAMYSVQDLTAGMEALDSTSCGATS